MVCIMWGWISMRTPAACADLDVRKTVRSLRAHHHCLAVVPCCGLHAAAAHTRAPCCHPFLPQARRRRQRTGHATAHAAIMQVG